MNMDFRMLRQGYLHTETFTVEDGTRAQMVLWLFVGLKQEITFPSKV